jgi:glycosyltransferase involved in cell wall biosynthesis
VTQGHPNGRLCVLAETAYPQVVAGARVRVAEMAEHLAPLGISMTFASNMTSMEYALVASPGVGPRKALALVRGFARSVRQAPPPGSLTLVHRLRSLVPSPREGAPLDVYDFDDALYVGSASSNHAQLRSLKREAPRCVSYMSRARLVLAGNRVLADAARAYSRNVEVIPSCVDPSVQPQRHHVDAEALTLGWIGSRTTSAYLTPVLRVIESLYARGSGVHLVLMGADPSLTAPWIEHRAWSIQAERQMLTEIDVGLMPLPDDQWTRGKCGYKLLRYFSAGLPTIASPVGVNKELLEGARGFAASKAEEWASGIEELAHGANTRTEIGVQARSYVEREYSYKVWAPRVAELLRAL